MSHYPAREAREKAGMTLAQVARRLCMAPRYLAECERRGRFPLWRAEILAAWYGCPLEVFLPPARSSERFQQRAPRFGTRRRQ
jgi:transcriptional regulator with XRE-family HTH domain